MNRQRRFLHILAAIAFLALAANAFAQQRPIWVIQNSGWANSNVQSTPPAAVIMSTGACTPGPNCDVSIAEMSALNPLTFYPSSHIQSVTVTSAWGPTFDAYASVFAQGGNTNYSVAQVLTNDGVIPSNFFQNNQANGGTVNLKPATVTSVQVLLAPFSFQLTSGGWWVAVGKDGKPPQMSIRVYGSY